MGSWLSDIPNIVSGIVEPFNAAATREVLTWLGGGLVVVLGGIWAVMKFFAERKKPEDKKSGGPVVTHSGQGPASGRDTTISGNVIYGAGGREVGEAVAEATRYRVDQVKGLSAENALLAVQLEQARTAPAAPVSEVAVAEAVQSIEEGAAEGDTRLARALDLLKAGEIAEAVEALEKVAEDKTARVAKDRKEAAIAHRNLGAIAGLKDPRRALAAYRKALERLDHGGRKADGKAIAPFGDLHAGLLEERYRSIKMDIPEPRRSTPSTGGFRVRAIPR